MTLRAPSLGVLAIVFVVSSLGAACGGGSSSSTLEGVYTADTWTENPTACNAEGPSVLADQSRLTFYVKLESFLGETFINVNFCDDLADCQALANDEDTLHLGSYFFTGSDGAGWTTALYSGFAPEGGNCEGEYVTGTLTAPEPGTLRLERREQEAGGFPPEDDGFCDDDKGAQAAEGQPCSTLEVFTATTIGSF